MPEPAADTQPPLDWTDEDYLLAYLRHRELACPLCQYNLRGLTVPRCPECGRELKLTVGTLEPYLTAWIVLMAALAASAGLGLLFLPFVVRNGWPGDLSWKDQLARGLITAWMASIPLAPLAMWHRRTMLKWTPLKQWILAWIALAFIATSIGLFVAFIR